MTDEQAVNNLYRFSRLEVAQSKAIHDSLLTLLADEKTELTIDEYDGALIALGEIRAIASENEFQRIKQALKAKTPIAKKTAHSKSFETVTK